MRRTVRLKLDPTAEQAIAIKNTLQSFTRAFNYVCQYGWQDGEKNGVRLHHCTYYDVKGLCADLVSDLIIQARVKATEALKSVAARQKAGRKAKQPQSELCPARYNIHTFKLSWDKQEVNLATSPANRIVIPFAIPKHAEKYIGYPTATADLIYRKGSFYLHVGLTLPDVEFIPNGQVIGVDLGLNHPAVTSNRQFLGSNHWKEIDRRYFRLKRALQSKGTKSAKRHLKKLANKQQRFHRDCDHVLAKRIVQSATPGTTIVIENLTEIRSRARAKKGEGQRRLHSWSFAQMRSFLSYKAEEAGMQVVAIDPRHTSQTCSRCGFQHRSNRKSQSLFLCRSCSYRLNADLNASYNIRAKHLASLGISLASGPLSTGLSSQLSELGTSRLALAGGS